MKNNVVGQWGIHKFKADANLVAQEIKSIGDEIKPDMLVQYATENPDSEVHKCFTWDNNEAADKWRLQEARMVMKSLTIIVTTDTRKEQPIRMYMRTSTTSGYKETVRIYQNEDELDGMLRLAKAELFAFENKYRILSNREELKSVFSAIHDLT